MARRAVAAGTAVYLATAGSAYIYFKGRKRQDDDNCDAVGVSVPIACVRVCGCVQGMQPGED